MEPFIVTRAAKNLKDAQNFHESISCASRQKKTKDQANSVTNSEEVDDAKSKTKEEIEAEIKKYRHDVIKFGMSGLQKLNGIHPKAALAISLGAIPPKNKKKNYKKIIQERKQIKAKEIKEKKLATIINKRNMRIKLGNKSNSNDKKEDSKGILGSYGKPTNSSNPNKKTKVCILISKLSFILLKKLL